MQMASPHLRRLFALLLIAGFATILWTSLSKKQRSHSTPPVSSIRFNGVQPAVLHHELADIANLTQRRLLLLQNPKNCESARRIICIPYQTCGLGCQVHHVTSCLMVAYATNRTLLWQGPGAPYTSHAWWGHELLPLSESCAQFVPQTSAIKLWTPLENTDRELMITIPNAVFMQPTPDYMPPAIPADLASQLVRHHSAPSAWWVGQLVSFLLRPSPQLLQVEQQLMRSLNFFSPIAGVHVRRGDKLLKEAKKHELNEYMQHVHAFFHSRDLGLAEEPKFRVLLATDDPNVVVEAKQTYTNYTFLVPPGPTINSAEGLSAALLTLRLLAMTDFLVCTFSSNVGRLAYELMQAMHPGVDFGQRVVSLDAGYYYHGQGAWSWAVAVHDHLPGNSSELALKTGDVIQHAESISESTANGVNTRTKASGVFPKDKVTFTRPVPMPLYPGI